MLNLKDQAEGLRTLLGNRGNKSFIVLSALDPSDRNAILLNISVAIIMDRKIASRDRRFWRGCFQIPVTDFNA